MVRKFGVLVLAEKGQNHFTFMEAQENGHRDTYHRVDEILKASQASARSLEKCLTRAMSIRSIPY